VSSSRLRPATFNGHSDRPPKTRPRGGRVEPGVELSLSLDTARLENRGFIGRQAGGDCRPPDEASQALGCQSHYAGAPRYTKRRDNAHKTKELEVLYRWHPWFGRVVHVHEVIEQRAGGVLRCSPDGDASRRWLELPQWMFDRAACLAIRMTASPRVDTAALMALKTCLADASGAGLCGGPLSKASASGARRSSCNQNQGAARATQIPPSTQPSSRRQAVRSFRSARREAPDPGVRVATAAGEDPRDGDQADGAPTRRPPTPRSRAKLDGRAR
jgi:hypothetical protein